jgi:hypothetical protein
MTTHCFTNDFLKTGDSFGILTQVQIVSLVRPPNPPKTRSIKKLGSKIAICNTIGRLNMQNAILKKKKVANCNDREKYWKTGTGCDPGFDQ